MNGRQDGIQWNILSQDEPRAFYVESGTGTGSVYKYLGTYGPDIDFPRLLYNTSYDESSSTRGHLGRCSSTAPAASGEQGSSNHTVGP